MRLVIMIGVLLGMLGCGDNTQDVSCVVVPTDVVSYQDCKATTPDGLACVMGCGRLPDDGGLGTLLDVGCQVQIGTSAPRTGECVASCADCSK